jgi:hypothetical protein
LQYASGLHCESIRHEVAQGARTPLRQFTSGYKPQVSTITALQAVGLGISSFEHWLSLQTAIFCVPMQLALSTHIGSEL